MSESQLPHFEADPSTVPATPPARRDPTDKPIPVWPDGVVAVAAIAVLAYVCVRHRTWITRKVGECQRAVDEFQRQGGAEELGQLAKTAVEFFKGAKG
jgi:hypothetical protein